MKDLGLRQVSAHKTLHTCPWPRRSATLTATTQLAEPEFSDRVHELIEPTHVIRDSVVLEPPPNDVGQPASCGADRVVPTSFKLNLNRRQGTSHAFGHCTPPQHEALVLPGLSTDVGKAQEVERLAASSSFPFASGHRAAAELDQSGLIRMKREAKLLHPRRECRKACVCVRFVLETDHKSTRVPDGLPSARLVLYKPEGVFGVRPVFRVLFPGRGSHRYICPFGCWANWLRT
jgi:hypothetical protein